MKAERIARGSVAASNAVAGNPGGGRLGHCGFSEERGKEWRRPRIKKRDDSVWQEDRHRFRRIDIAQNISLTHNAHD